MIIDPKKVSNRERYALLVGGVVPRPIAFVSTMSPEGRPNLAPFSFFTAITSDPPTVCFAPGRRSSDGDRKDTLRNIEATGEFVVNVVTEEIGQAMHDTAGDYPPGTNEFEVADLTPVRSHVVKPPRVKESPLNMECTLYQIVPIGPDSAGGGALVIGEIVMFHVADEIYENGRIKIHELNPLGRLAGTEYTTLGRIISMTRKPHQPKSPQK
jgi:flavin reductase (DIM6/NTAB) family NADH-FMN oxidoreductase RutF